MVATALMALLLTAGRARAEEPADAELIEIVEHAPPGSAQTVGTTELERFEHDEVHQVLQGAIAAAQRIDPSLVVDLAGSYELPGWGRLYATVDKLFDEHQVVARRPFGMRPGAPRLFTLGYKQDF